MDPRLFAKYLRRCGDLPRLDVSRYTRAVVIPAYDEAEELPRTLDSLKKALRRSPRPAAVIVVVNHPAGASEAPSLETLRLLEARKSPWLFPLYAPGISGGVGGARKLGMDAFLAAHPAERIDDTVICSLDADTRVEEEYFYGVETAFELLPDAGVCTFRVRHEPGATPELERAIREYEAYLSDYVENLRRAGSPYAFSSIGSAFAVRGATYIHVGGMKVRNAGEDFYFLQECAKCAKICASGDVWVHPSARLSGRNAFGTGPALKKILSGEGLNRIAPAAFDALRDMLRIVRGSPVLGDTELFLSELPEEVREFLESCRFPEVWSRILANTPENYHRRAFHRWFDGLKTLRMLHALTPKE